MDHSMYDEKPVYSLHGYLGVLASKLRVDVQMDMQERLTLQMKSWNDTPAVDVRAYYQRDGYFWFPRFFFPDAITSKSIGKHQIEFNWTEGSPVNLPLNVTLDPKRGQPAAVDAMANHLRLYSGGILCAPTGCGKTILGYAIGHRLNTNIGVLVYNGHMVKNWVDTAKWLFGLSDDEVGLVQQDRCDLGRPVTVMMVQSLLSEAKYPDELYQQFGLIIADECVTGDTVITTNVGPVPIANIPTSGATEVLSFNVSHGKWELKGIKRWIPRNKRAVIEVRAGAKRIRCTPEHLFLTNHGWLPARELQPGFLILSPAPVVAEGSSTTSTLVEDQDSFCRSTSENSRSRCQSKKGSCDVEAWRLPRHSATAVAENKSGCIKDSRASDDEALSGRDSYPGTTLLASSVSHSVRSASDSYTEHCLEIPVSPNHGESTPAQRSISRTGRCKDHGLNTRQRGFSSLASLHASSETMDLGAGRAPDEGAGTLGSTLSLIQSDTQSGCPSNGSPTSQRKVGPGGTWMMAPWDEEASGSALKGTHEKRLIVLPHISENSGFDHPSQGPKGSIGSSVSGLQMPSSGLSGSGDSAHPEWNTSFLTITEIVVDLDLGAEQVYDLEIEDNHNFVANGVLVHNCVRFGAPQWNEVLKLLPARYRLGLSADPVRDDGLDKLIGWHFGKIAHKVVMSTPKPNVVQVKLNRNYHPNSYSDVWKRTPSGDPMPNPLKYDKVLADDEVRNKYLVGELVKMRGAGRRILIFSRLIEHLECLRDMFVAAYKPALQFGLDGESDERAVDSTKVTMLIGGLKNDKLDVAMNGDVIFTTYAFARDALNLPAIDTLLFATPPGKPLQPIGRLRDKGPADRRPLLALDPYESCDYAMRKAQRRLDVYEQLSLKTQRISKSL